MASIDICYAVAAYNSVTESFNCLKCFSISLAHLLTMRHQTYTSVFDADTVQVLRTEGFDQSEPTNATVHDGHLDSYDRYNRTSVGSSSTSR
jgi:hypothetical protein